VKGHFTEHMDLATAKRIIDALADGVDPRTGEVLDPGSPIQSADVVRALRVAATAIDHEVRRQERHSVLPTKAGKAWNTQDDQTLSDSFDSGRPVVDIAKTLQRTRGSIASRLVMLGKVPDRQPGFVANLHSPANGH
jgi:hypothetical protein